jgi:hypothetical protein
MVVLCSTYLEVTLLNNQNYKYNGVVIKFYDDSFVYRFQWYRCFCDQSSVHYCEKVCIV